MGSLKGQNNTVKRFQTGGHAHEAGHAHIIQGGMNHGEWHTNTETRLPFASGSWSIGEGQHAHQLPHETQSGGRGGSGGGQLIRTGLHTIREEKGLYRGGGRAKKANRPVRRSMAGGGVAKVKSTSNSSCCRGNGGKATPRPTSRPTSRPAPLSGGSRGGGVR